MKLFISSILLFCLSYGSAFAQAGADSTIAIGSSDTTVVSDTVKPKEKHFQYFRVGVDLSKLVRSMLTDNYNTAEFMLETIWKPKMNYVAEAGFANAINKGENANIFFKSSSYFLKAGFDKYFFGKLSKNDLDNAFVGLRVASALLNRQEAQAKLWDPAYGNTIIIKPASTNLLYWLELTAGFRMELKKNIFVGWNIRGKSFFKPKPIG